MIYRDERAITAELEEWAAENAALVDRIRDEAGLGGLRGEKRRRFWASESHWRGSDERAG